MPKLIENVLIGDRVRLAGEDISEADAKGVRPEVFAGPEDQAATQTADDQSEQDDKPDGADASGDDSQGDPDAEEEQDETSATETAEGDQQADEEPAKSSSGRGKRTSTK